MKNSANKFEILDEWTDSLKNSTYENWHNKNWKIWIVYLFIYIYFLTTLHGLWDLSSQTRDQTQTHGSESAEP